jgi:hypothetical protein
MASSIVSEKGQASKAAEIQQVMSIIQFHDTAKWGGMAPRLLLHRGEMCPGKTPRRVKTMRWRERLFDLEPHYSSVV